MFNRLIKNAVRCSKKKKKILICHHIKKKKRTRNGKPILISFSFQNNCFRILSVVPSVIFVKSEEKVTSWFCERNVWYCENGNNGTTGKNRKNWHKWKTDFKQLKIKYQLLFYFKQFLKVKFLIRGQFLSIDFWFSSSNTHHKALPQPHLGSH